MSKKFYITTPIYYVNDIPHIGHAYTTIAADTVARHRAIRGYDTYFLTGTDEHGQKIEQTATRNGEKPIELANRVVKRFQELWRTLKIKNTDFIRTTEKRHREAVEHIFKLINDNGDIYLDEYEGWYDVRNESFLTDTQLEEVRKIPEDKRPHIEKIKEESYFFKLSKYEKPLLDYYENNPEFIKPSYRKNEVISFVESGLRDLSISRTTFSWGIPVPENGKHTIYVWFDALTNYLTSVGFPNNKEKFEKFWPPDIHLVGKDILRFHAVYWPAFLMSASLPLPKTVYAHGWWTTEGEKMSKSLGNVIDPHEVIKEFNNDIFRYFLLREIPFGQDGDYSRNALTNRINGDLANGLGNLVSRTLGMVEKYFDGKVPAPVELTNYENGIKAKYVETLSTVETDMEELAFNKALVSIWEFIAFVNKYIDETAPWKLAKKEDKKHLSTVLWTLVESLRVITLLCYPFLPETAQNIWKSLGYRDEIENLNINNIKHWGLIKAETEIKKGENLFNKIKE